MYMYLYIQNIYVLIIAGQTTKPNRLTLFLRDYRQNFISKIEIFFFNNRLF